MGGSFRLESVATLLWNTHTVLKIKGNTVKLGVTAPKDLAVHRSEVYVRIGPLSLSAGIPVQESD